MGCIQILLSLDKPNHQILLSLDNPDHHVQWWKFTISSIGWLRLPNRLYCQWAGLAHLLDDHNHPFSLHQIENYVLKPNNVVSSLLTGLDGWDCPRITIEFINWTGPKGLMCLAKCWSPMRTLQVLYFCFEILHLRSWIGSFLRPTC